MRGAIRTITRAAGAHPGINFFLFEHPATSHSVARHSTLVNPFIDGLICDTEILAYFINSQPTVFHRVFLVAPKGWKLGNNAI
jgi:hypothetical protein